MPDRYSIKNEKAKCLFCEIIAAGEIRQPELLTICNDSRTVLQAYIDVLRRKSLIIVNKRDRINYLKPDWESLTKNFVDYLNMHWIKIMENKHGKLMEILRKETRKDAKQVTNSMLKEYGDKLPDYMKKRLKQNKPSVVVDKEKQKKAALKFLQHYLGDKKTFDKISLDELFAGLLDFSFEVDGAPMIDGYWIQWATYEGSKFFFSRNIEASLRLRS